jgi:hypothetical protein
MATAPRNRATVKKQSSPKRLPVPIVCAELYSIPLDAEKFLVYAPLRRDRRAAESRRIPNRNRVALPPLPAQLARAIVLKGRDVVLDIRCGLASRAALNGG